MKLYRISKKLILKNGSGRRMKEYGEAENNIRNNKRIKSV